MVTEKRLLVGALCGGLLCSCSEPQDPLFPGPIEPITEIDCIDGNAAPPVPLGVIDGWSIAAGWESRVVCEHRQSHSYVDVSIPGQVCLGLNRDVGAMVAHPPVADGPGTYAVKFAAQVKNDQLIEVALSRGTDSGSPDWARSVSVALECFRPCESATDERPRQCRPVVRFHDTPELGLETDPPHGRFQALPGHSDRDYELKCALRDEYGFPLPTTGTITAEIVVEGRSLGWKIDGALVSGFGPSYQLDHTRWSCERMDGTPAENVAQRLFVVGMPFAEAAKSPDQPGYELAFEHWSPDGSLCASDPLSPSASQGAWMCVRDARYASCSQADCPEACGDGTCDAWETCSTCQSDCGVCGPKIAELAIASIDCGQSINNGAPVSCDIVLANQGTADAGEFDNQLWLSHDQTFSSGDTLLGGCMSSPIKAGATSTITCGGVVPPATEAGTWYLGLIADSSAAVVELDESNNLGSTSITVVSDYVPPTDLVIALVDCFTLSAVTGGEVECGVTVKNVGGLAAGPFLVDLRLSADTIIAASDTLLTMCEIPGLDAGSSQMMTCKGTVPVGTPVGGYYLGAMADSQDTVAESDDSNNTGHDPDFIFVTQGPADLVVSSVDCPGSATSPGSIACSVKISNQGDSSAIFFSNEIRLSDDTTIDSFDTLLGSCSNTFSLSAGQSQTITCKGQIPAGKNGLKYVGIIADSSSSVSELDENNNTGHDPNFVIIQQSPADLVVSNVDCPFGAKSPGSISCSVTMSNQGGSSASSFTNQMRLSDDTVMNGSDTLLGSCSNNFSLSAGQSTTIMCTGTIPAGKSGFKYVGIIADSSSQVSESNENNNTGYTSKLVN